MKWTWTAGNCQVRATLASRSGGFFLAWKEETSVPWGHIKDHGSLFVSCIQIRLEGVHWHITMQTVPQTHWKQYTHRGLSHFDWTKSKLYYVILLAHSYSNDEPHWIAWAKINWIELLDRNDNTFSDCAGKVLKQCVCQWLILRTPAEAVPFIQYLDENWNQRRTPRHFSLPLNYSPVENHDTFFRRTHTRIHWCLYTADWLHWLRILQKEQQKAKHFWDKWRHKSYDGILKDILHLTFAFLFIDFLFLTNWLCWKFQSHLWELTTEQEVTHGSYEVFPFTLGTRELLIKVDEEIVYFWI